MARIGPSARCSPSNLDRPRGETRASGRRGVPRVLLDATLIMEFIQFSPTFRCLLTASVFHDETTRHISQNGKVVADVAFSPQVPHHDRRDRCCGAIAAATPAMADAPAPVDTTPAWPGQSQNPVWGAADNPVPTPRVRTSRRIRTGRPGLMWTTYGYNLPNNSNIPEDVWKADIDWFIAEFGPHGYDTIATDGWIESSQRITKNGYIVSQNDEWSHDFSYWIKYLAARNFKLSLYYNPFWITESARTDRSVRVAGRPDVAVADLTADWDPFTTDKIYWLDPTRPGAKEYVQGYIRYFEKLGAVRLRTDFVSWFENGWDQNLGQIQREHGRLAYLDLLEWIDEAAGPNFELSLVLPTLYFHGVAERGRTDSFRIDDDAGSGGWSWLSAGRQSWQPYWTQWHNPFTGFTGWSDVNGPGLSGWTATS